LTEFAMVPSIMKELSTRVSRVELAKGLPVLTVLIPKYVTFGRGKKSGVKQVEETTTQTPNDIRPQLILFVYLWR
jgi:hypothetical protein